MLNLQAEARTISGRTLIKNIEADSFPCQDVIYGSLIQEIQRLELGILQGIADSFLRWYQCLLGDLSFCMRWKENYSCQEDDAMSPFLLCCNSFIICLNSSSYLFPTPPHLVPLLLSHIFTSCKCLTNIHNPQPIFCDPTFTLSTLVA